MNLPSPLFRACIPWTLQEDIDDWRAEHTWRTMVFMTADHMYYSYYVRGKGRKGGREGGRGGERGGKGRRTVLGEVLREGTNDIDLREMLPLFRP